MLNISKEYELKDAIINEAKLVDSYKNYEQNIKDTIEKYLVESKCVSFDNDTLKIMLFNNFENAAVQIDNNLLDIESLGNVLDILASQESVSKNDTETYNKLAKKAVKNMEITQNFIQQTIGCFEHVNITGQDNSLEAINNFKQTFIKEFPFKEEEKVEKSKASSKNPKSIKREIDYSSSDLLCFFPKTKDDNLVISTVQNNYEISFDNDVANIHIKDEDFNLSLTTPGVQISNSNTNNILYVSHSGSKYTIITNNQIEIPFYIYISKVNKNDDFLEIEISRDSLLLSVEDNVLNFKEGKNESIQNNPFLKSTSILDSVNSIIAKNNKIQEISKPEIPNNNMEIDIPDNETIEEPEEIDIPDNDEIDEEDTIPAEVASEIEPVEVEEIAPVETPVTTTSTTNNTKNKNKNGKHSKPGKQKKKFQSQTQPTKTQPNNTPNLENKESTHIVIDDNDILDNDTLIISDTDKNVILPYKINDLRKIMQKNKNYNSLKHVVEKEYTIPLEAFKNPVKSRFREAFQLIKKKEHGSLKEAVGLGFELMFQSNLNPAVIAACKDLDELDIYLDCLDDNELDKFSCFKIAYTVPPTK